VQCPSTGAATETMVRSWRAPWLGCLLAATVVLGVVLGAPQVMLVSSYPLQPLEPVINWRWMPVGENGNVYRFPMEWGVPAPPPTPKKRPKRVEVEEMTSFQDWLREMVDGKVIDQDLGLLLNSLKEAVKTVTAITRFPVTRKAASSDGAFVKAADEAFRDEVVNSPGAAGMMFSSESAQRVVLDNTKNISVSYDPLICSENIAVGLPHGSMFRVSELVKTGTSMVAAGYALYGSATVLVVSVGRGVEEFTLDEDFQFRLTGQDVQLPKEGAHISVDSNEFLLNSNVGDYFKVKRKSQEKRFVNDCLIGDFHRILKKGGLLMDIPNKDKSNSPQSITFHLAPLAFLVEQAGGAASNGSTALLHLKPKSHKETSQFFIGSQKDVRGIEQALGDELSKLDATPTEEVQNKGEQTDYFPVDNLTSDVSTLFESVDLRSQTRSSILDQEEDSNKLKTP